MSTAKRFAEVKPGDVLSIAGQPLRVENSEAWSDHNWYVEGQLTDLNEETSLILSNDAMVMVDSPRTDTLHLGVAVRPDAFYLHGVRPQPLLDDIRRLVTADHGFIVDGGAKGDSFTEWGEHWKGESEPIHVTWTNTEGAPSAKTWPGVRPTSCSTCSQLGCACSTTRSSPTPMTGPKTRAS